MSNSLSFADQNPAQAYQMYLVPPLFLPAARILLDDAELQTGERVLDVACGTGVVARESAPRVGAQGRVTGLDITPPMLGVARSLPLTDGAAIEWSEGSALALPFPDHSFDLVVCQQGLQFFPDRAAALQEMRRVLATNGRVRISVQQSLDRNPIYAELNRLLVQHLGVPALGMPFSMGDVDMLQRLLADAGFHNVEIVPSAHTVRFANPETFLPITLYASSAAVPALAQMDTKQRAALNDAMHDDVQTIMKPYIEAGALVFTMAAYIARATA
ncbi:MAG: methyltransferase domain-containing protein [Chloroflexota bacterium]|nr:methyltransferase domain-containing protein [Chloroflexota bacterium]